MALGHLSYDQSELTRFGALLVLGLLQAELSRTVEHIRRTIADAPHINMTSVWTFAGVLVLPPGLVAVLAVVLYFHLWLRVWRHMPHRPTYRVVYSAAAIVLSCLAGSEVAERSVGVPTGFAGSLLIVESAVVFTLVNAIVIAVSVFLHTGKRGIRSLFGGVDENSLELATLVLGGLTALCLSTEPALVPFLLLPVLVLHRGVLVRQLEIAATIDGKTGVLNSGAWHRRSEHELSAAAGERSGIAVLMLDLDHFKRVNDDYGHLAGDTVLRAVAATISAQVRAYDSVGRFGGEEFVVLLPEAREDDVLVVAERIRRAVMALEVDVMTVDGARLVRDLSVSIGVSVHPSAGLGLERLLHTADSALYQAKRTGRNRVVSLTAV